MQNTYDVIILGAGASGMTAAIAAHENGLSAVSYTHLTLPTIA